jgi:hypothetical protein
MNSFFQQLFKPQPRESQKPQYSTQPDPGEILQAHLPDQKYRGLLVDWNLTIQSMYSDFDPDVIVVLTSFGKSSASIWISVKGKTNPEIYDHGSGSQVNVKAMINTIQGENIYLDNCQLQF